VVRAAGTRPGRILLPLCSSGRPSRPRRTVAPNRILECFSHLLGPVAEIVNDLRPRPNGLYLAAIVAPTTLPATWDSAIHCRDLPEGLPTGDRLESNRQGLRARHARMVPVGRFVHDHRSSDHVRDASRRVRTVRSGGPPSPAKLNLTGGASEKRVVIRLPKRNMRFVSAKPNRPSLRGTYGLFDQRLRAGGSKFVLRLNARESIRRGSVPILRFWRSGK
jgi:hypothetical protein